VRKEKKNLEKVDEDLRKKREDDEK